MRTHFSEHSVNSSFARARSGEPQVRRLESYAKAPSPLVPAYSTRHLLRRYAVSLYCAEGFADVLRPSRRWPRPERPRAKAQRHRPHRARPAVRRVKRQPSPTASIARVRSLRTLTVRARPIHLSTRAANHGVRGFGGGLPLFGGARFGSLALRTFRSVAPRRGC